MKIDFYDLFSLHTPEDISESGGENYMTAAVRNRVHEKLAESLSAAAGKVRPKRKLGKIIFAAAAAVIVLISGTFAASALGIIDIKNIFRGIFTGGFEHLESNVAVPQNVVTTGDDRLSMKVLAIGGTESEAFGTIEIKRNDGGTFPEHTGADSHIDTEIPCLIWTEHFQGAELLDVVDENTAIYRFRISTYYGDSLIGTEFKLEISDIVDVDIIEHEIFEKEVILEGDWSISFPLEYNADYRKISVNETVSDFDPSITEIGYSSTCLDLYFPSGHTVADSVDYQIIIKLDNGEEYRPSGSTSYYDPDEMRDPSVHYIFDTPIDIDHIESIMIDGLVIPVK